MITSSGRQHLCIVETENIETLFFFAIHVQTNVPLDVHVTNPSQLTHYHHSSIKLYNAKTMVIITNRQTIPTYTEFCSCPIN